MIEWEFWLKVAVAAVLGVAGFAALFFLSMTVLLFLRGCYVYIRCRITPPIRFSKEELSFRRIVAAQFTRGPRS